MRERSRGTGQEEQGKACRNKQHVKIDNMKEMSNLICGRFAVGGNYNSTRDNYFAFDGLGDYMAEEADAEIVSEKEGMYNVELKLNNPTLGEKVIIRLDAFLKEENAKTYWSFINIAEPMIENTVSSEPVTQEYSEDDICKAAKKYTNAPIVEIDHYDGLKPVVHCYEFVIDDEEDGAGHTATYDWLTVDPGTLISETLLGEIVDLSLYLQ